MIRPMLAHHYRTPADFCYPYFWLQPKLDGIRVLIHKGTRIISRDGIELHPNRLQHIRAALAKLPVTDLILDGELYCHGMPLQKINSRARVTSSTAHEDESALSFCCYDLIAAAPFGFRYVQFACEFLPAFGTSAVCSVPTHITVSHSHATKLHAHYKAHNFEGTMLRNPVDDYRQTDLVENRVRSLLKRKDVLDAEASAIGYCVGDEHLADRISSLHLQLPSGITFWAGSGLSDAQRLAYKDNPDLFMGKKVRVEYERPSVAGIPLKPIIVCVYE